MASGYFQSGLKRDFNVGDYEVLLVGTGYTHDPDAEFVADISGDELSGDGYERKSVSPTQEYDASEDEKAVFVGDLTWEDADFGEVQGAILFEQVTDDTDSPVCIYSELDESIQTNTGDFTFVEDEEGFGKIVIT